MVTIAAVIRERRLGSFGMPREVTAMKLHPFLFYSNELLFSLYNRVCFLDDSKVSYFMECSYK